MDHLNLICQLKLLNLKLWYFLQNLVFLLWKTLEATTMHSFCWRVLVRAVKGAAIYLKHSVYAVHFVYIWGIQCIPGVFPGPPLHYLGSMMYRCLGTLQCTFHLKLYPPSPTPTPLTIHVQYIQKYLFKRVSYNQKKNQGLFTEDLKMTGTSPNSGQYWQTLE